MELQQLESDKQEIITLFRKNVKGVDIRLEGLNTNHSGKEGYWLENKMGLKHNAKNEPDMNGYEMKTASSKTSLGDYSASEYAFSGKNKRHGINALNNWTDEEVKFSRSDFIRTFGNPNEKKNNRYSWSGKCVPTYNTWNSNGQMLVITEKKEIIIYYSFAKDTRNSTNSSTNSSSSSIKTELPEFLKCDKLVVIALWKVDKMKPHIENKFNKKGIFICKKIGNIYEKICFGKAFDFDYVLECIKNKKIIFDSGMNEGNSRNYSMFRGSSSSFWHELITEEYS
jgi:hypothetical protein